MTLVRATTAAAAATFGLLLATAAVAPLAVRAATADDPASPAEVLVNGLIEGKYARTSNIFLGQNKNGPYLLGYKNIRKNGARVMVDGNELKEGEWSLDANKGSVSFKTSLKQSSIARVDYQYEPARSPRNENPAVAPVTLNLLQNDSASLQLTALPSGDSRADGASAPSPLLVLGASGKTTLAGGGLTSQVLVGTGAKVSGTKENAPRESLWDRTGLRLGYDVGGSAANKLSVGFSRAGQAFAPAAGRSFNMDAPVQKFTLGAKASPAAWLGAELQVADLSNLADHSESEQRALLVRLLGLNGSGPVVNLQRTENVNRDARGTETSVTVEKIAADGRLNPATTLSAQAQRTTTETGANDKTTVTAGSVAVNGKVGDTAFAAQGQQSTTEKAGRADSTTVAIVGASASGKLNPLTTFSAQAQRTTMDAPKPDGDNARTEMAVTLVTATKDGAAKAALAVKSATNQTVAGLESQRNVQIAFQPAPVLSVSAAQTRRVLVPADSEQSAGRETVEENASAELKNLKKTARLSGALTRTEQDGDTRMLRAEIAAEAQPLRYLSFAGGMITRDGSAQAGDDPDTQRVRLSVQPADGWSLSGSLVLNPEQDGRVLDAVRQEWGMAARLGGLQLGGGYALTTLNNDAKPAPGFGPQSGELSVNVGLRFSRWTQMSSTFKDVFTYGTGAAPHGLRVYGLGLTHNLGQMNLSLGGSLTEDKAQVGVSPDVKAEAKLGLKF